MLKKTIYVLAGLLSLILVLGLVAPKDFKVEREVVIAKPKEVVFANLKFLKNHGQWSPWEKKDINMTKFYSGEDGAVGFIAGWSGNSEVGVGEQEIKKIVEGERLDLELRFQEPMEGTNTAYLITEAMGDNQTKVRWGMEGHNRFPANVVCMLFNMKDKLGKDFDAGLASLKQQLEQ